MSKLKYYIVIFLCAVGMTACQDDLIENASTKLDTNKPVQVELKFSIPKSMRVEVSRAADNSYSTISTLRLYVFDGNTLIGEPQSFTTLTDNGIKDDGHHYSVNATLYQGTQTVYAVANANRANYWNDPTEALDAAAQEGKSAFLETVYDLFSNLISDNYLPTFTSETIPLSGEGEIRVTGESNPTATGIVRLQRLAAKIVFDITEESKTGEGNNVTFTPQYFGVYKVAGRSYVMNSENERTSIGDEYFYNTSNDQPITRLQLGIFVPENIQKKSTTCIGYDDRDEVDPEQVGASDAEKSWINAPANATYIVIKGTYVETDNTGNLVRQADVSYTVHLGDWSKGDYNDFSVLRNYIYTYHMEVKGVHNIVVEAKAEEDSDEFQDAAEGDVIEVTSGSEVFNLDAHYEQVYVEYDLTDIANQVTERFEEDNTQQNKDERIKELIANSFILSIHTPMNLAGASGELLRPYLGEDETGETSMDGLDWRWIEMYSQTDNGISTYTTAHNSEYLLNPWEACRKMGEAVYQITQNQNPEVDDLQIATSWVNREQHYMARFTIFVDEFFYTYDLKSNPVDWADFTRIDPRTFMIATDIQVSPDGNSSYATARTYISQASILTFYNRESADNTNALGIESYNEYGIIKGFGEVDQHSYVANGDYLSNGRANMIRNTSRSRTTSSSDNGIDFTHIGYISSNTSGHLWTELEQDEKEWSAYKACLSRNRDLNGNGRIDDNEIHWYLPSRSQYLRMGIGANSLGDYQLYTGTKSKMNYDDYPVDYADEGALYYSNTPNGNSSSSSSWELYWAVEVGAYGSNSYGDGIDGKPDNPADDGAQIRCVRNLPSMAHVAANDDPNGDEALAGPVYNELKTLSSGNYIFDFGNRLDGTLYRATVQEDPYISHTEVNDANMLPAAFVVAKEDASEWSNGTLKNQFTVSRGWSGGSDNPCADYYENESDKEKWRVPNLSELMVMSTVDTELRIRNKVYLCSTQFSNPAVRSGFRYNSTLIAAWDPNSGNQTGYVRCVRDATQAEIEQVRSGN